MPPVVRLVLVCLAGGGLLSGCTSESGPGAQTGLLPSALSSRWAPPAFATREIEGGRGEVFDACVAAADGLGYSVVRLDATAGRISAARRQTHGFDGARQDTLEINVISSEGGGTRVELVLRETVESGGGDERSAAFVAAGIVRDRMPYDVFFARLAAALRGATAS